MQLNVVCKIPEKSGYSKKMEGVCSAVAETIGGIYIWSESQKAAWDMFYEYNPSILFCLAKDFTSSIYNAAKEYNCKVVCLGSSNDIPIEYRDFCFICTDEPEEGFYHLRAAANLVDFVSKEAEEKYSSDVVTILEQDSDALSGLWDFKLKVFSVKNKINHPNYIGCLEPKEIPSVLSSTKVYLDFHGDEDMICACMANKIPAISASKTSFDEKIFPKFGSNKEFVEAINSLMMILEFRNAQNENCYDIIVIDNTYFHIASEIFSSIGYEELAENSLKLIKDYL